jgi:hypothetical protein
MFPMSRKIVLFSSATCPETLVRITTFDLYQTVKSAGRMDHMRPERGEMIPALTRKETCKGVIVRDRNTPSRIADQNEVQMTNLTIDQRLIILRETEAAAAVLADPKETHLSPPNHPLPHLTAAAPSDPTPPITPYGTT